MIGIILALMTPFVHDNFSNDALFFDQFHRGEVVAYTACRVNDDVRALVFYQSINNPDFVEITSGHVSMMAHIQLGANKLKVIDANGGVSTYEKIHDMAKFLSTLSLKLSGSEEIRQVLADKTSINSCSNAGNGPSHS